MIEQVFHVESYWEVAVFYDLDYNLFYIIEQKLISNGISNEGLEELYSMMHSGSAKAATFSNVKFHTSIVLFNKHSSKEDYINSIVHEAEHVKQAMLYAYNIEDSGEPPAYTMGYLVWKMWEVFRDIVCCNDP